MKSAIRNLNLKIYLATRPLLGDKPAIAATGWPALIKRPSPLIKRPLRLAGLDKTANRFASP